MNICQMCKAGLFLLIVSALMTHCGNKDQPEPAYMDLADHGQLDSALTLVTAALQKEPENRLAQFYLGKIYYFNNKFDQARQELERCVSGPGAVPYQYHLYLAQAYDETGAFDQAAAAFRQCLKANPALVRDLSGDTLGYYAKNRYYLDQRDPRLAELAVNSLKHALQIPLKPASWPILYAEALLYRSYQAGLKDQARFKEFSDYFQRIEVKHGQDPAYIKIKGLVANDREGSVKLYRQALAADPDLVEAHCLIGDWLLKYHDAENALKEYRLALEADSTFIQALLGTGWVALKNRDYKKAEGIFNRVLQLNTESSLAWYNLGVALENQRKDHQPQEAIGAYEKSVALNPQLTDALYNLGRLYYLCYKYPLAASILDRVIKLNPRHYDAYVILSNVYTKSGQPDQARAILKTVLQFDPDNQAAKANLMKIPEK